MKSKEKPLKVEQPVSDVPCIVCDVHTGDMTTQLAALVRWFRQEANDREAILAKVGSKNSLGGRTPLTILVNQLYYDQDNIPKCYHERFLRYIAKKLACSEAVVEYLAGKILDNVRKKEYELDTLRNIVKTSSKRIPEYIEKANQPETVIEEHVVGMKEQEVIHTEREPQANLQATLTQMTFRPGHTDFQNVGSQFMPYGQMMEVPRPSPQEFSNYTNWPQPSSVYLQHQQPLVFMQGQYLLASQGSGIPYMHYPYQYQQFPAPNQQTQHSNQQAPQ